MNGRYFEVCGKLEKVTIIVDIGSPGMYRGEHYYSGFCIQNPKKEICR